MKRFKKFSSAPLLMILAALVLSATVSFAQTPSNSAINGEKALTFKGRVVSVDASGVSMSVRGDDGFKTFQTHPSMVKDVDAGDVVNIFWAPDAGGPKALSVRMLEKTRHGSQAQQIREERIRARHQEAAEKAAKRARNLQ